MANSSELAKQIRSGWEEFQNHPHRGIKYRPCPDLQDLEELVELAFHASYKCEEDVPIRAALSLISPNEVEDGSHNQYLTRIQKFESTRPLDEHALPKIAPAFDARLTSICVHREADSRKLVCWGVSHHRPTKSKLDSIPVAVHAAANIPLDSLTIVIDGAGKLTIARQDIRIGRIVSQRFVASTPSPFGSRSLGGHLFRNAFPTGAGEQPSGEDWRLYRSTIEVLLNEIAVRGHGGCAVLLPECSSESWRDCVRDMSTLRPPPSIEEWFRKASREGARAPGGESLAIGYAYKQALREELERMGQLATVDGALLLNYGFSVLGYGARLHAPEWSGIVAPGPDGFGNAGAAAFSRKNSGTRHNSAIDFIGTVANSIAFVVSQDGPIRAFYRQDDQTMLYWADCNESMFM